MPPGPGGDEFVGLLNKLNSRHRVSTDVEKLTKFMRSVPDPTEIRSPQGILAFEKTEDVQRLGAGRDSRFQTNSIENEPFGTQGTPSFLQIHAVGGSAVIPKCALLSQEPGALNAVDILLGTAPGCSPNIMWSSGDPSMDSVVKKEEQEEEYRPLFSLNPPPQQKTYPFFRDADALVKEEVDEDDGYQDSEAMEGVVKEEYVNDDEFADSGDHAKEFREALKKETNQVVPNNLSTTFIVNGHLYQCKLCGVHFFPDILEYHWSLHPLCSYCGMRFNTEEVLSEHKRMHTTCEFCGKNFASVSNLRKHRHIHSGEKQFQCEVCQTRFTQKAHLAKHRLRKHRIEKQ